ncbi:MAG: FprA family A-type flavoprotein [Deltaproteobacteria bacterium]|nr:FprA family A-type flavoprotein [Deltaproteobacteria bacterium]
MNSTYRAVRISENVYWVGAIDWNIRDFHGYTTRRGSTYNAYLVIADKVTLIDTVKAPFKEELLARIASVIDPRDVQYIVSNHSEMDHSGCLHDVIDATGPERVYASVMGEKTLKELFGERHNILALKDGDTIDLGNMALRIVETRMLHWPDSMFSYLESDGVLFSQDAFGMHLATSERFDDEIDPAVLEYEAATYYANILLPYSSLVLKLLERVGKLGYQFNIVAPDHGPVWRKDIQKIFDFYERWAVQKPTGKALVLYATMWHSTELMARAITEGLASEHISVRHLSTDANHRSDAAYEVLDAGALIVGSPTLNNNMFPAVADVLNYLKGLRPLNLIGASFGSSGWSGESVKQIETILRDMKVEIVGESLNAKHRPDEEMLSRCFDLGAEIGKRLKGKVRSGS